ncbi:cysteine peptidase family C39 domain-containing protein [Aliifodinibius sp. S!AR15-10]|uniref:cysteine peptidase family C39 domain-containing protein n=1 Tax=Aliifodinibius sp. S!AR15-10 TaxID=2950437 RepID=UPI002859B367|nr:cysteine peptidase family C39 domain-containing protein [Aliifodinibius sp. S!AR15-10]MDR8391268.1 cysteine peptidase family C39 domain-containing protein [Aliifodinibius sp. S!AR15-10]
MGTFKIYRQYDAMDCGPTCLRMVAKHHGREYTMDTLRNKSGINREGVSLLGISEAAESIGFRTVGAKLTWEQLADQAPLPCVVYWDQRHFVVVYKIKSGKVYIADPAKGRVTLPKDTFVQHWLTDKEEGQPTGVALLLHTTPKFYDLEDNNEQELNFGRLLSYIKPYKNLLFQLALGLGAGSILQLIFPFLTQAVVDIGINNRDLNFIYLVLIAQVMLFIGRTGVEFIRSWILLHMSTRINVSILSDFLIKLMKLPMGFFDTKMTGDIMQRMEDHRRIQEFLTNQTLSTVFSFVNLLVFSFVLAYYNMLIFVIFLVSSSLYVLWVFLFLKKRRELDYQRFGISSSDQSKVIQIVQGMQSIKLNSCERQKRWEWERLQARLFRYRIKNLGPLQNPLFWGFFPKPIGLIEHRQFLTQMESFYVG